jgi:UDP-glucose 4-epimerase
MRMKILVTGGSGFVGASLVAGLGAAGSGHELLAPSHADLDLLDAAAVHAYLKAQRPDAVVHCAVRPGHRNAADPSAQVEHNTRMFFDLARCSGLFSRMVFVSSGAVYGAGHFRPAMDESYFDHFVPADEHGFSKYVCAKYAEGRPDIVELRPFGVFGAGEDYAIRFVSNAICKTLFDLPITIKQNRKIDYLCVDDLTAVVDYFLREGPRHGAYNVCSGHALELRELAELVLGIAGKQLPIAIAQPGMGEEYSGSNARLRAQYRDLRLTPLETAVSELYDWYAQRKKKLDRELLLTDR